MKRYPELRGRRTLSVAGLALSLVVAGCASATPGQSIEPEPVSCTNSYLMELRTEHPDSLSGRGRRQLLALERECRLASAAAAREHGSWTNDQHSWWMGSGLAMALMILVMWIRW